MYSIITIKLLIDNYLIKNKISFFFLKIKKKTKRKIKKKKRVWDFMNNTQFIIKEIITRFYRHC